MRNLIISPGIRKSRQLLLSAVLVAIVVGAFGTTALVALFARDLVSFFTSYPSSAIAEPQPMFDPATAAAAQSPVL